MTNPRRIIPYAIAALGLLMLLSVAGRAPTHTAHHMSNAVSTAEAGVTRW